MLPSRPVVFRSGPSISSEPANVIYLLDTSAISALMRSDGAMAAWLSSLGADDRMITCDIARGEILFGIERLASGSAANRTGREGCEGIRGFTM